MQTRLSSTRQADKISDQCGDLIGRRIQCEMTGVEKVNLSVGHIPAIGFRFREVERRIILASGKRSRARRSVVCDKKSDGARNVPFPYPTTSKMISSSTGVPSGRLATPYTRRQGLLSFPNTSCSSSEAHVGSCPRSAENRRCRFDVELRADATNEFRSVALRFTGLPTHTRSVSWNRPIIETAANTCRFRFSAPVRDTRSGHLNRMAF
jgi:hypothetical protein